MAYNTSAAKYKSAELAALDCSPNTRQARTAEDRLWGNFTASATQVLGIGECVAMIRIPAGAVMLGADLYWNAQASASVVAVGDPFACGRFIGPVITGTARGVNLNASTCTPWGACGTMMKMGTQGDGCGIGYTFTCETDLVLTNLYSNNNATMGGWAGSDATVGSHLGAAISAGKFTLIVNLKPV